jgi:hypothetical protein
MIELLMVLWLIGLTALVGLIVMWISGRRG